MNAGHVRSAPGGVRPARPSIPHFSLTLEPSAVTTTVAPRALAGIVEGDRVVGRVRSDAEEVAVDGLEQVAAGRRVINRGLGQRVGHDHPRCVAAEMELLPVTPVVSAVFRGANSPSPITEGTVLCSPNVPRSRGWVRASLSVQSWPDEMAGIVAMAPIDHPSRGEGAIRRRCARRCVDRDVVTRFMSLDVSRSPLGRVPICPTATRPMRVTAPWIPALFWFARTIAFSTSGAALLARRELRHPRPARPSRWMVGVRLMMVGSDSVSCVPEPTRAAALIAGQRIGSMPATAVISEIAS